MQLTKYTDFGLRVMMYLTQCRDRSTPVTIPEIADRFAVSRNHLVKVVHFLGQQGWVITARGKGGGLRLSQPPVEYRLGDLIYTLEHQGAIVNCGEPPCTLQGFCLLSDALASSLKLFYDELNRRSLADLVASPTKEAIVKLHLSATTCTT